MRKVGKGVRPFQVHQRSRPACACSALSVQLAEIAHVLPPQPRVEQLIQFVRRGSEGNVRRAAGLARLGLVSGRGLDLRTVDHGLVRHHGLLSHGPYLPSRN
ncbi:MULTISPECIES: hypothetical protein [Streptomyces]|uniref:hypothetical protein n=1 Tax=Streptomyces TaxID=1883 RepID=UPI0034065C52